MKIIISRSILCCFIYIFSRGLMPVALNILTDVDYSFLSDSHQSPTRTFWIIFGHGQDGVSMEFQMSFLFAKYRQDSKNLRDFNYASFLCFVRLFPGEKNWMHFLSIYMFLMKLLSCYFTVHYELVKRISLSCVRL